MTGLADLHNQVRSAIAGLAPGVNRLHFKASGARFPVNLKFTPGARALIIHLHGSVNRETRKVPLFPSWVPDVGQAHQISIPDPSMGLLDRPFNISWYAGHDGFDTQAILAALFASAAEALGVERSIYFGNSGGGFAALYYAHCHPGSFAVVGNPQTDILCHHSGPIDRYRTQCWPALKQNAELAGATCTNLPALYGQGFANTVIYVQSLGDRTHYVRQMLPFAQAVAGTRHAARFLLQCDFNGTMGHAAAPQEYRNWMRAIINSPTAEIADILAALHDARTSSIPARKSTQDSAARKASDPTKLSSYDRDDIALAERLRKWRGRAS